MFVDIGGIVDHHCLEVVRVVDIGEIVDNHCLEVPYSWLFSREFYFRGQT